MNTPLLAFLRSSALVFGLPLTVLLSGCGGGAGSSGSGSGGGNNPPTPAITSISPTTVNAGASALTLTVNGSNFLSTSVIQVGGTAETTTFVSSSQLTAVVPASQLASGQKLNVTVANGTASSAPVTLEVDNPVPAITSISPTSVSAGTTSLDVVITGTGFVPTTAINVNSAARTTKFSSSTQVTVTLNASDVAAAASLSLTAVNAAPGGGTSAVATLTVAAAQPTPVIASVTPTSFTAGSPTSSITVSGSNLTNCVVQWNGTTLNTLTLFPNGIVASVPAGYLASAGTAKITANNPDANPSTSNAVAVSITNPSPSVITSISPAGGPIHTDTTITLYGTDFAQNDVVYVNGQAVATTYMNPYSISAKVPASAVATPGLYPITVQIAGVTSSPSYFTAYVPIFNNSMVYNPTNGLFYLSVSSAAPAPYGNSIVSVDPLTGALGTPIPVGSEPDQLALTSDGKYLWVALDGASAMRKVDLTTGTAGLQFPLIQEWSGFAATALAALPGATDSVVVATPAQYSGQALAIYDSGVIRGTPVQATFYTSNPWAILVDGTKNEIYAAGGGSFSPNYNTYTYDSNGLTLKASTTASLSYADQNHSEAQILNGRLYTDFGQVDDAESGALLGTFYSSGTVAAQGSTTVDPASGIAFVLEGYWGSSTFQLQSFNISDFTANATSSAGIYNPDASPSWQYMGPTGMRLTRWGTDGLAFRSAGGFVSFHSSLVKDLTATIADLGVTLAASGTNATGATTTYTAKVTNAGPSNATGVLLTATTPSSGQLTSIVPSTGTCSTAGIVTCNLGTLANGASTTVVFKVLQTEPGNAAASVQVSASENDPNSTNNQATSTIAITGSEYALVPALAAISPAAIASGSSDTVITVSGIGFVNGSTVQLGGAGLATSYVSSTQLTATVPAANLKNLGWAAVTVSNPAPGGGTSSPLPLTVFSVLTIGVNHILYDPFSRKLMAAVGSGSSSVQGSSIVDITPETATIGSPVALSAIPTSLALSSDGQMLYALVPGDTTAAVTRFNMLTYQVDFSVSGFQSNGYNVGLRDIATQPGTENTIAVDEGEYIGFSIFDFDPVQKTATRRGQATGVYAGTCLAFSDANDLFAVDLYGSPTVIRKFSVTSSGLNGGSTPSSNGIITHRVNCFKISGSTLGTLGGDLVNIANDPATQIGLFEGLPNSGNYGAPVRYFDLDASLGLSYFLTQSNGYVPFDAVGVFDNRTFLPVYSLPIPFSTLEGSNGFAGIDVVRWGQDGLAVLTSGGHIYLLRGAAVVPQLLSTGSAASLSASSLTSIAHGTGNTVLTLTGSNFQPGMAVTWNGSYRTTTLIDASHATVAIPATDLVSAGSASLVATNPGASGSSALQITIN